MAAGFVGVDWGTSNARFMLVDASGRMTDERRAPGVALLSGAAAMEAACFEALGDWPRQPVVMTGAVGSNIGWHLAPYQMTPATPDAKAALRFEARGWQFALLPGVQTLRADGFPDVMRGEETQIFGGIGYEDALVCLPGTHCKWAVVTGGTITGFHTAMTGELLNLIGCNSVLLNPKRAPMAQADAVFLDGVAAIRASALGLETQLFTTRSRQIAGTLSAHAAEAYLAGLCIGADIRSALSVHPGARSLTLIGAPQLTVLYANALATFGVVSRQIDGRDAVLKGLIAAHREIFG